MAKRENDLGRDPIGKLLLRLAVPTVTAQLVNALYNIVDRIYIGHIPGEGDLAPVSYTHLTLPTNSLV